MKLFFIFLLLAVFIQSSFLGINLALVLITARSFASDNKSNFYFAFMAGVLIGVLTSQNIGIWALAFVILVKALQVVKKLPVSANYLTIFPYSLVLILLIDFLTSLNLHFSFQIYKPVIEAVLVVPIFVIIKFWEERFVPTPAIKLKIRK